MQEKRKEMRGGCNLRCRLDSDGNAKAKRKYSGCQITRHSTETNKRVIRNPKLHYDIGRKRRLQVQRYGHKATREAHERMVSKKLKEGRLAEMNELESVRKMWQNANAKRATQNGIAIVFSKQQENQSCLKATTVQNITKATTQKEADHA